MSAGPLRTAIHKRRAAFARAAQNVLDEWQQDDEGVDEVFGAGGACDAIANAFRDVLDFEYIDADGHRRHPSVTDGGHPGDDHAWLIAYDDHEAVAVDLPANVYETGGGYRWRKRPGVRVHPSDLVIEPIKRSDIEPDDSDY